MDSEELASSECAAKRLEEDLKASQQMRESLIEEASTLHDLLNREKQTCSATTEELRRANRALEQCEAESGNLRLVNEKAEVKKHELKTALRSERETNKELQKQCSKLKNKIELLSREHAKGTSQQSEEVRSKVDSLRQEFKVSLISGLLLLDRWIRRKRTPT